MISPLKKASSIHLLVTNSFPGDFAAQHMVTVSCSSKQSQGHSRCCAKLASLQVACSTPMNNQYSTAISEPESRLAHTNSSSGSKTNMLTQNVALISGMLSPCKVSPIAVGRGGKPGLLPALALCRHGCEYSARGRFLFYEVCIWLFLSCNRVSGIGGKMK